MIATLEPKRLWHYFSKISEIPRPSKHEEKILEFIKEFANENSLEYKSDRTGNIVIKKPGSNGLENQAGIVLQSHVDMVPQKNEGVVHDFTKDPIQLKIEGEWLTAVDTTLGADNGIGVAAILAILEDKTLQHPPLEGLFTVDEETGMTGAFGLEKGFLQGKTLLNLDTEDEGVLCIGCAGGIDTTATGNYKPQNVLDGSKAYKITLKGLKGGHSGMDINLGRGNANKLLFRFLHEAGNQINIQISAIDSGGLRNAIPREGYAIICLEPKHEHELKDLAKEMQEIFKKELSGVDDGICIEVENATLPASTMDGKAQKDLIRSVIGLPNGAIRMIPDIEGVVETSTNLARVEVKGGDITIMCLLRGSIDTAKTALCNSIASVFELAGYEVSHGGSYPGWQPNFSSPVLEKAKTVYQTMYNKPAEVEVVHAGLECGIIGSVFPGMDMISFGPTIKFPHSPDEKVEIASVRLFWDYLVALLK